MHLLQLVLLSFLWQLNNLAVSPKELTLRVFEDGTTEPIPDCYVLHNGMLVGKTDEKGVFKPAQELYSAKIVLKHMSYIDKKVDLTMLPHDIVSIPLKNKQFSIEEVAIKSKKRKVKFEKMGIYKQKPREECANTILGKLGLFIPNTKPHESYVINQLCIYIVNRGNPCAPFLLSLYAGEKEYLKPNDSLKILGPILLEATKGDEYLKINLYDYKLSMPGNGLFVVLENPANHKRIYQDKRIGNFSFREDISSIRVGDAWEQVNKFYSWRHDVRGWLRDTIYWDKSPKHEAVHHGNSMIYVTLRKTND